MLKLNLTMTAALFATGVMAFASDPIQTNNSNAVWFENWTGLSGAMMRVADPDGRTTDVRAELGTPVYQLSGDTIVDGIYRYELRATTDELVKNRDFSSSLNSDEERPDYVPKAYYRTGSFTVARGVILRPEDVEAEGADKDE